MTNFNKQLQKITTLIFAIIALNSTILSAQEFKTIGYLHYYRFALNDQIKYDKITHLNIAFANPDMSGNLSVGNNADIAPIVETAHDANVEVYISLAGGALTPAWAAAWESLIQVQNRSAFISKIIQYTLDHNLEGIDVDLEWSHVNADYSGFVLELRDSVDNYDLGLTAALPGTYRYPQITNAALAAYDWINMMVYDLTGPWNPSNVGPHSPYSFAENAINYWVSQGVPKNKLTLGVPFYGYDFTDQNNVTALTYASIVAMNPNNAQVDQVGQIYYNGIPTIEAKTALAMNEVSGIMIWELGQDTFDEYSLLDKIYEVIQMSVATENEEIDWSIEVFPNPFENQIRIQKEEPMTGHLFLTDANGRLVLDKKLEFEQKIELNTNSLSKGIYFMKVILNGQTFSRKLIKG
jgi:GH18 family chitinase